MPADVDPLLQLRDDELRTIDGRTREIGSSIFQRLRHDLGQIKVAKVVDRQDGSAFVAGHVIAEALKTKTWKNLVPHSMPLLLPLENAWSPLTPSRVSESR